MKKQNGNKLMQKWKNKAGVRLSALDKKKLVLTNLPYVLTAFYADRASCLYRSSPGEDIGNKLLYAMEHADRIFTGILLSFDLRDLLVGVTVAVILKLLVWQKQSDAKKLRKGIEYMGYKEIFAYLDGECTLEEAKEIIKRDTRHFAKRQITWFKRERDVIWINKQEYGYQEEKILERILKELKVREIFPQKEEEIK